MSSRKTKKARKETSAVRREEDESEEEEEEEDESSEEEEEESEEGEASGAPADSMSTTACLSKSSWEDLGLSAPICEACRSLKWTNPSQIQVESIPYALDGKDIIGLAETGSGKVRVMSPLGSASVSPACRIRHATRIPLLSPRSFAGTP